MIVQTVLDFELIIVLNFVLIDRLFSIWILPTKSMLAQKESQSVFQKNKPNKPHFIWSVTDQAQREHSSLWAVNQCNYQKDTM